MSASILTQGLGSFAGTRIILTQGLGAGGGGVTTHPWWLYATQQVIGAAGV